MALEQLQKNLGQLGALAAIALAMGSVSGELDRGTAALVLAQPATRPAFLLAKLAAIAVVLGGRAPLVAVGVAWIYTAILFEPLPDRRLGGDGGPVVARAARVGGDHVPRLGGDRLHDGRRRASGSWP